MAITKLIVQKEFTAPGGSALLLNHTYQIGEEVPELAYAKHWTDQALTNRLAGGFVKWEVPEMAPPPIPTEDELATRRQALAGGGQGAQNAKDDRIAVLQKTSPEDLKVMTDAGGIEYKNKPQAIADLIAKEFGA